MVDFNNNGGFLNEGSPIRFIPKIFCLIRVNPLNPRHPRAESLCILPAVAEQDEIAGVTKRLLELGWGKL
ncbi:hypothetical protein GMSM_03840 [Geomonas sp. Red276]